MLLKKRLGPPAPSHRWEQSDLQYEFTTPLMLPWLCAITLLLAASPADALTPPARPGIGSDATHRPEGATSGASTNSTVQGASEWLAARATNPPPSQANAPMDPETRRQYLAYERAQYHFAVVALQQRADAFAWEEVASQIILFMVLLLVFAALWFAWLQFRVVLMSPLAAQRETTVQSASTRTSPAEIKSRTFPVTVINASMKGGLKVSSPVLGVIILIISLLFFYLYLRYVYPITVVH